ncbi:hypothetical protein GCM10010492_13180 [Saccharothrix mutabilis subsp. mutabilis]|uniref:Ribbon-helix-helix protein CopG domain-containing protein n=1 Tax=Saccharothrix mutabilis subsp. mutabilis TaxID=66855 RepID=A0ABP3CVS6_9PSEU
MSESVRDMLAREAAEAKAQAEAEERGEVAPPRGQRGRKRAEDPSQVYAVRIPVSRINELRELAESLDVPPSALIRQWVIEKLDAAKDSAVSDSAPVFRMGADSLAPGEVRLGPARQSRFIDDVVSLPRKRVKGGRRRA